MHQHNFDGANKGYTFYMGKGMLEDANNNNQSRKYMKFAKNEV